MAERCSSEAKMNLRETIKDVVEKLDKGSPISALHTVEPLRKFVKPHIHVGRTEWSGDQKAEWYAGQLLAVVEEEAWFAMNSILNAREDFLPETTDER